MENNRITLVGQVTRGYEYSHTICNEDFYSFIINVKRSSGNIDKLKCICSSRTFDVNLNIVDKYVYISGSVRTRNNDGHLIISVFVDDLELLVDDDSEIIPENEIYLEGYICKNNDVRETPFKRLICDQLVAINRNCGRSDYLPLIYWGRNAQYASTLPVGTKIKLIGRLQSRDYMKSDGISRTAYEISVCRFDIM